MGRPITRRVLGVLAAAAMALGLSACGGSGDADLANGKEQFANKCSGCHTLADSGRPPAAIGPNLDDAFRGPKAEGFETSTFEGVIKYWIRSPEQISQPIMQPNLVTGKDADDVAAYVASVAGKGTTESPARPAEEIE